MNQSNPNDIQQLEEMLARYNELQTKLADPQLEHHERQVMLVACYMLKDFMANKTRDVQRHLRGTKGH